MPSFEFNTADAPELKSNFDPLPAGTYEVMVTRSDVKQTKAGNGHYIELEMQVVSGEHSGRRHWERLNVSNPNKTAEDIAKANLAALCNAIGIESINETEELHDQPFLVDFEIDRKDPTRNRITGYDSAPGTAAPAPASKAPPKPAAAAAGRSKPWG